MTSSADIIKYAERMKRQSRDPLMLALCDSVLIPARLKQKPKRDRAAYMRGWRAKLKVKKV